MVRGRYEALEDEREESEKRYLSPRKAVAGILGIAVLAAGAIGGLFLYDKEKKEDEEHKELQRDYDNLDDKYDDVVDDLDVLENDYDDLDNNYNNLNNSYNDLQQENQDLTGQLETEIDYNNALSDVLDNISGDYDDSEISDMINDTIENTHLLDDLVNLIVEKEIDEKKGEFDANGYNRAVNDTIEKIKDRLKSEGKYDNEKIDDINWRNYVEDALTDVMNDHGDDKYLEGLQQGYQEKLESAKTFGNETCGIPNEDMEDMTLTGVLDEIYEKGLRDGSGISYDVEDYLVDEERVLDKYTFKRDVWNNLTPAERAQIAGIDGSEYIDNITDGDPLNEEMKENPGFALLKYFDFEKAKDEYKVALYVEDANGNLKASEPVEITDKLAKKIKELV